NNLKVDLLVSNPPYINKKTISTLDKEIKDYEPITALDGGDDGLYYYKEILNGAINVLNSNGKIIFEIGYDQKDDISIISKEAGYTKIDFIKDFSDIYRVAIIN
ncbi:MAG: hypothetical protein SNJ70_09915, partial [Armatimonadota bacterium]